MNARDPQFWMMIASIVIAICFIVMAIALIAIAVIVRRVVGTVKRAEEYSEGDYRRGDPRYQGENFDANVRAAGSVRDLAARKGATPAQVALAWLIRKPNVVAIPGASSVDQLRHNVEAADLDLTDDEAAELTAESDRFNPIPIPATVAARLRARRNGGADAA